MTSQFQSFPAKLRDDEEIARLVLSRYPYAYRYLSPRLRAKREFALKGMAADGFSIASLPDELKNDEEIVRTAYRSALARPDGPGYDEEAQSTAQQQQALERMRSFNREEFFKLISPEWREKLLRDKL